jgi:hypothetical protein
MEHGAQVNALGLGHGAVGVLGARADHSRLTMFKIDEPFGDRAAFSSTIGSALAHT